MHYLKNKCLNKKKKFKDGEVGQAKEFKIIFKKIP